LHCNACANGGGEVLTASQDLALLGLCGALPQDGHVDGREVESFRPLDGVDLYLVVG
jgi:hypothetical protein